MALALTTLIAGAIASAIQIHMIALKDRQQQIEQTHVARNVLDAMANDLRAAMQYKPFADDDMVNLADADTSGLIEGAAGIDTGGLLGQTEDPTELLEQATSPVDNISTNTSPLPRPGFYGSTSAVVFDISRLPRRDQYAAWNNSSQAPASDIQTTSYFLSLSGIGESEMTFDGDANSDDPFRKTDSATGGLYRRTLGHIVAANSNDAGELNEGQTELLAPEIVDMAMRYFDGEQWLDAWDSDEQGGFPSAVEIVVIVDPRRVTEGEDTVDGYQGFDPDVMSRYRRVVHLPAAEMLSEEELQILQEASGAMSGDATGTPDTESGETGDSSSGDGSGLDFDSGGAR